MAHVYSMKKPGGTGSQPGLLPPSRGNWRLNATKGALLITLLQIIVKGEKHYCTPHPKRLLELLALYHRINIERRWFFQCMHDLEDGGYVSRQRRWSKIPGNIIRSKSSIWYFTLRGAQYLSSKAVSGARDLLNRMLAWLHHDDSRQPAAGIYSTPGEEIDKAEAMRRIKGLIEEIGRPVR